MWVLHIQEVYTGYYDKGSENVCSIYVGVRNV